MKQKWKTIRQVTLLLMALGVLALPARFTNSVFGYLPILLGVGTLACSGVFLLLARRGLAVTGTGRRIRAVRCDTAPVELRLVNRSPFVCPKVTAEVYISDYFDATDSAAKATFALDRRCSVDFGFDMSLEHVGVYTAGVRKLRLYGLLGLWSLSLPLSHKIKVTVLPKVRQAEDHLADIHPTDSSLAQRFLENDGFDYTGAREYVHGDSLKNIHWKLSAHTHTLMTRIREVGLQSDLSVILDTVTECKNPADMLSVNDALMEIAVSLCHLAAEQEINYRLLYTRWDGALAILVPRTQEDYAVLVESAALIRRNARGDDAESMLRAEAELPGLTANVVVCTSRVTEGLLQALIQMKAQRRSPMLYYILSPESVRQDRSEAAARVRMLDEHGIRYEVISS